jgi:hypothetical protein
MAGWFQSKKDVRFLMFCLECSNPPNQPVESSMGVLERQARSVLDSSKVLCPGHMNFLGDIRTDNEARFCDLLQFPILFILHVVPPCYSGVKALTPRMLTGGTFFFQSASSFVTGMLSVRDTG